MAPRRRRRGPMKIKLVGHSAGAAGTAVAPTDDTSTSTGDVAQQLAESPGAGAGAGAGARVAAAATACVAHSHSSAQENHPDQNELDDDDHSHSVPPPSPSLAPRRASLRIPHKMQIERKVRLVTEQKNIPKESPMPEFPMKQWSVKLYLLDQDGNKHPASCFNKVVYNLHPSFENPQQTFHEPPFTCSNEGWGEFEMSIDMYTTEKNKITIFHDLNFQSPEYKNDQAVTFKNPSQALVQALRETGPVGNDDEAKAIKARKAADSKKRKFAFDYEKMGDAMTKLGEDDLLHVIQMIHDHKSDDTVTNNDIERGEFSVDLFTMPESLAKMIWEFLLEQKMVTP